MVRKKVAGIEFKVKVRLQSLIIIIIMPKSKYYCDYCDSYLAASMKARKQHNDGWRHRAQVKEHFAGTLNYFLDLLTFR